MSDVTQPPPRGKPCWFELPVPEPAAPRSFYETLLGWTFEGESTYQRALLRGRTVAAIGKGDPAGKPAWLVYLAADDLAETVAAVTAAGGQVVQLPHDTPAGRVATVAEPTGGVFGLLDVNSFQGSEIVDEPSAVCWAEASSKDPSVAGQFFASVFGLEAKRPYPRYTFVQLRSGGKDIAGILGYSHERRPKTGPAAWLVYFQVADTDRAVSIAVEHGGRVLEKAHDTAFGRFAVVADPLGARFAVITREQ